MLKKFMLAQVWIYQQHAEADLGGGCKGCAPPPPPWDKLSSSYSLLIFVYLPGQWRHSLEVHPFLRKILGPPLRTTSSRTLLQSAIVSNHSKSLQTSLHYNLSPQAGLLVMRRKLHSTFFRSERLSRHVQYQTCYIVLHIPVPYIFAVT